MNLNKEWHAKNRMRKNASIGERIAWHMAHARHCGCRPIPQSLMPEIQKRELLESSSKVRKK